MKLLAGILFLSVLVLAEGVPGVPAAVAGGGQVQRHQLPNGLTLLTEERPTSRAVTLVLMLRAGSRDDGESPGLLYFLSRAHLLGTQRRPSEGAVRRAISSTGGTLDRGTARDLTQFVITVPADEFGTALDVLSDILQE